ncbi:hypothetical protein JOE61_000895 [Nocardioides salarius]|uniref:Uncharacterized protein n=1 Tax=Nocardioides salarius TaxID=374513 RepID=A0ABS2M7B7_9ACTN|nr:hypothetical protein [Nocardioides salarius]
MRWFSGLSCHRTTKGGTSMLKLIQKRRVARQVAAMYGWRPGR